jgi:hypothetical protein
MHYFVNNFNTNYNNTLKLFKKIIHAYKFKKKKSVLEDVKILIIIKNL